MSTTSTFGRALAAPATAAALGALLVLATASPAAAQQSKMTGNFDLQFGPYYPRIDREFQNATPFQNTFGANNRVMIQLDSQYYIWQGHGKLGIGATAGYTKFSGETETDGTDGSGMNGSGTNGSGTDGGSSSGDDFTLSKTTNFTVFPLGIIASYRWDYAALEWGIPFAARVEGGFDYYLWRLTDGSGNVPESGPGAGGTPGFHVSGRIEFLLDWIDPQSASQFDFTWGINNTYLFAEYTFSRVRDFDGEGFRLGDNNWRIGLSFDF